MYYFIVLYHMSYYIMSIYFIFYYIMLLFCGSFPSQLVFYTEKLLSNTFSKVFHFCVSFWGERQMSLKKTLADASWGTPPGGALRIFNKYIHICVGMYICLVYPDYIFLRVQALRKIQLRTFLSALCF